MDVTFDKPTIFSLKEQLSEPVVGEEKDRWIPH